MLVIFFDVNISVNRFIQLSISLSVLDNSWIHVMLLASMMSLWICSFIISDWNKWEVQMLLVRIMPLLINVTNLWTFCLFALKHSRLCSCVQGFGSFVMTHHMKCLNLAFKWEQDRRAAVTQKWYLQKYDWQMLSFTRFFQD